jgi:cobalamin biosynthesis protein CobW
MARKIPATVITGFLGAGKTSLIRRLIEQADGRRLGFIINEFGDLGIDRSLIEGCGLKDCDEDAIKELANGCICCTVADDFLPTMESLLARANPPEHIIIETSGLALPKPLVQAFNWPSMKARVTVDGVVTVIDGAAVHAGRFADDPAAIAAQRAADPSLDHDNPLAEVFDDQLACADLVVVNKLDLVAEADRAGLLAMIDAKLRPAVKRIATQDGKLPLMVALGIGAAAEDDLACRPSIHEIEGEHDHDDFDSFVVPMVQIADPARLARHLATVVAAHDILRIKGFIAIDGAERRCVIQGVGERIDHYFDRAWRADEARAGALVVIGLKGLDRVAIERALA